jgi:hypothetical protein
MTGDGGSRVDEVSGIDHFTRPSAPICVYIDTAIVANLTPLTTDDKGWQILRLVTPMIGGFCRANLRGEILVPYRSPQQHLTEPPATQSE